MFSRQVTRICSLLDTVWNRCTGCPLLPSQKTKVPTELPLEEDNIDLLVIGEAPGKDEDKDGRPFVGRSGSLLRESLKAAGLINVAFSNIVRCNPLDSNGDNRGPNAEEVDACVSYVREDILRVNPKLILFTGGTALRAFFGETGKKRIAPERGHLLTVDVGGKKFPAFITFHPAYILRKSSVLPIFLADLDRSAKFLSTARNDWPETKRSGRRVSAIMIETIPDLRKLVDNLLSFQGPIAIDTETNNLNIQFSNKVLLIQIALDEKEGFVIPFDHKESSWNTRDKAIIVEELNRLFGKTFSGKKSCFIFHNGKFDISVLSSFMGIKIPGTALIRDTQILYYLLDENRSALTHEGGSAYKLKTLVKEIMDIKDYEDLEDVLEARAAGELNRLPLRTVAEYGALDACVTLSLYKYCLREAMSQGYLSKMLILNDAIMSPLVHLSSIIERNGCKIDREQLRLLGSDSSPLHLRGEELEQELYALPSCKEANRILVKKKSSGLPSLFGDPWIFDIGKLDHLRVLFYDVLDCELNKAGKPSTDKHFLEDHTLEDTDSYLQEAVILAEWRGVEKLRTSYANSILKLVREDDPHPDCVDGRVRASLLVTTTTTGRLTREKPNLQQAPKPNKPYKKAIRRIFIPEHGNLLVQLDYRANEVRWWSLISKDRVLSEAFKRAKIVRDSYRKNPTPETKKEAKLAGDIHRQTASEFFNIPIEEVTDFQRNAAKNIIFGSIYGRGAQAIADQIKTTKQKAARLQAKMMNRFVVAKEWLYAAQTMAHSCGYVESPFFRRRRLPAIYSTDDGLRAEAERQARNSPIQAPASDACIIGTGLFQDYIDGRILWEDLCDKIFIPHEIEPVPRKRNEPLPWKILNLVHDSNVSEVPRHDAPEAMCVCEVIFTDLVEKFIEKTFQFEMSCPLEVELEVGRTWGDMITWDGSWPDMLHVLSQT